MGLFRIRGLEMRLKPFLSTSTHLLNQSRSLQTLPAYGHNRGVSYIASLVFRCRAAAGCARSPRLFFSVSSHQELEWREEQRQPLSSFIKDDRQDRFQLQQDKPGRFVPVRAFFLSTSIDLRSLQFQNSFDIIPPASRATNYVILRFYDVKSDPHVMELDFANESNCHYMVVFQYGSVVLFNVSEHEADGYLKIVEKHASGLLPEMRKDDYVVVEIPTLKTWMQGGLDYIMLKNLSIDGIRIIGSVLGQSIALDYYIGQVDGMVAEFTDINHEMKKIGTFTVKKEKLFQLVGKANSNLADVILKLGLFERSDIAWKSAKYAQMWEYLRDEYELTQRFGSLDYKLKFVEHNIHTFQDILQNRKSVFMECLIIVLIALEILISLYSVYTH
ncbi:protein RETARDED ROOT GROWTH-LIKE-like isoform X1 [Musa acuminata AAA Group]|uniref:protein RETARDED ROOT GROWTH-LIKE-like isoform X1 n=1 Tax=Musa acuminata AAA Group TaxID=214697 RepID=UPI0031D5A96B